MHFTLMRTPLRTGLIAGAALLLSIALNPSVALAQAAAAAQSQAVPALDHAHIDAVLKGLGRGEHFGQVAISPDGHRLAWIEGAKEKEEIRVAPLGDLAKSERVTAAVKPEQHCHENQLAWSPDSSTLAFFSDCAKPGQSDLYLSLQGSPARRLTELKGYAEAPAFSPNGKSVAFLYVEGATRPAGALAAMKPPAGVIGEDGVEIERVAVVPVYADKLNSSGLVAPAMATPANLHVYEFDWRPDGKALAYVAADPPGENNWWVAKLYTQELNSEPWAILAPATVAGPLHGLQIAVPRWSPDGKEIAFIGGLMSDQGATGGDVWIVAAAGPQLRNLTPLRAATASWLEWDGTNHIFVSSLRNGNAQLARLDLHGNEAASFDPPLYDIPASVGDGRMEMSLSSSREHDLFVFQASSFDQPPEIFLTHSVRDAATSLSALTQVTHINDGVEWGWGNSVSLTWKSDKFRVQGWLTLPKDYDPAKKYPLIVVVHGGPASAAESQWGGGFGLSASAFSALGYFVLQPNPRGSFGQGEEFVQANREDFGYGDLRDILAGVDTVEAGYPVDPNRVGLTGWSYGGFMTMFAVTQTQRFKAAVADAGISNWQSYYGENSIDQWMTPYFGATAYDDPAVYAKSSAINFILQARTPTLVVVGDRDGECPAPQSFEFWHALRARNVPTRLVVYPNEGHIFADPAHRRDVMERAVEWFARYLPPAP
ncbi:MAG: S9 family peptidase [Terracidiphilus sp.]|jgi:dipeptidyl aminopeptidase/acylaminoacyl peptidase